MSRIHIPPPLIIILALLSSCATGPKALSAHKVHVYSTTEGRFMEIPAGLAIQTVLDKRLTSATTRAGEGFTVRSTEPIAVGTQIIIPEGTRIHGTVTTITPPRFGLMKAKIFFEFDGMEFGDRKIPIKGMATQSMTTLAQKGAHAAGGYVAKEALKRAIPGIGTVLLIMDAKNAYDTLTEDKEISIEAGTPILVKISKPFSMPLPPEREKSS